MTNKVTNIKRINTYEDSRFSETVLKQHGAYLIGEDPYEVEIIGEKSAVVRGKDPDLYPVLIEEFRFHAPHISMFYDEEGLTVREYPDAEVIWIRLDDIQPSQFYIDEEKLKAVESFIHDAEDIIIQVLPWNGRYISLDGHTRLYLAALRGYETVRAVVSETDEWIWKFVEEAQRRSIMRPLDMQLVDHERYRILWDRYCDDVFAGMEGE